MITVTDTGIGIPQESLPRVFDLFTRVQVRSSEPGEGLGIGLALVRRLVEMHGGTVMAQSNGLGQGAEFIVSLPLASVLTAPLAEPAEPEPIPAMTPRRILVADDNHDSAEALATLLQLHGHDVRVAHDGVEVLAIAESFAPDILLLDLGMPKMDGYETARQVRSLSWGRTAMVIALTGWGQAQDRQRTAEAGFDAHLIKPVTDTDLFHLLARGKAAAN